MIGMMWETVENDDHYQEVEAMTDSKMRKSSFDLFIRPFKVSLISA